MPTTQQRFPLLIHAINCLAIAGFLLLVLSIESTFADSLAQTRETEIRSPGIEGWKKSYVFVKSSEQLKAVPSLTRTIVDLEWTAPGDDGMLGKAGFYDVRYAQFPISEASWDLSLKYSWPPSPFKAGTKQELMIQGLPDGVTYYFALKTGDNAGNWSEISNVHQDTVRVETALCGDLNADQVLSVADIAYLLNFIFQGGPPPVPLLAGDADCNGIISMSDALRIIGYIFSAGALPCCIPD